MMTLRDVAKHVGVSVSTVSHVINGYDDINEQTRAKVLKAIRELNYHPNALARNLVKQRSHHLGIVTLGHQSVTHPFLNQLVVAIAAGVQEAGFAVALSIFDPDHDDINDFTRTWYEQRLEGLLVIGFAEDAPIVEAVANGAIPAVFIDTQVSGERSCWISSDNQLGAFEVTSHLIAQGHERIAFVQGVPNGQIIRDRFTGFQWALNSAGLSWDDSLYEEADFTKDGAYHAVDQLLTRSRPTAIFCVSDVMAFGAMACARDKGLKVPDDLAIVGFDDIPAAEHVTPALTTVRQPGFDMGRAAVNQLLHLMNENATNKPEPISLPTQLIVRESCGPPG